MHFRISWKVLLILVYLSVCPPVHKYKDKVRVYVGTEDVDTPETYTHESCALSGHILNLFPFLGILVNCGIFPISILSYNQEVVSQSGKRTCPLSSISFGQRPQFMKLDYFQSIATLRSKQCVKETFYS